MKKLILIAIIFFAIISCTSELTKERDSYMSKINLDMPIGYEIEDGAAFFMYKKDTLILAPDVYYLSAMFGGEYDKIVNTLETKEDIVDSYALFTLLESNYIDYTNIPKDLEFSYFQYIVHDGKNDKTYKSKSLNIDKFYRKKAIIDAEESKIYTPESSFIESIQYDGYYLTIDMKGNEYIFENVPSDVWENFKKAESKGTYYNKYIRGKYHSENY